MGAIKKLIRMGAMEHRMRMGPEIRMRIRMGPEIVNFRMMST